jgi:hypothetical protein
MAPSESPRDGMTRTEFIVESARRDAVDLLLDRRRFRRNAEARDCNPVTSHLLCRHCRT